MFTISRQSLLLSLCIAALPAAAQDGVLLPEEPPMALPQDPLAGLEPLLPGDPAVAEGDLFVAENPAITSIEPTADEAAGPTAQDLEKVAEVSQDQLSTLPRKLSFSGGLEFYQEDNIFLNNEDKISATGMQYTGRASVNIADGERIKLGGFYSYSALTLFDHEELNADTHDSALRSTITLDKTTIQLGGSYAASSGIDRRVGSTNDRAMSTLTGNVDREIGSRTRLSLGANYSGTDYAGLIASEDISARVGLSYLIGTKTRLGLSFVGGSLTSEASEQPITLSADQQTVGVSQLSIEGQKALARQNAQIAKTNVSTARSAAGVRAQELAAAKEAQTLGTGTAAQVEAAQANLDAANAAVKGAEGQSRAVNKATQQEERRSSKTPDQIYYQALVTAQYEATGKLSVVGSAGMDMRSYSGPEAVDASRDFTYSLTANYQPRERTRFSLQCQRATVGAITLQGSSIDRTSLRLEAEQKLGDKFAFTYSGSYEVDAFESIRTDVLANRTDKNWRHRLQVDYNLTKNVGLRAFYELDVNDSDEKRLTYDNNRYGLQLGISF
jgi:hypothetical protein